MLRHRADLRTLGFVFSYYVLIGCAVATARVDVPWWAELTLLIVLCALSFFCAVITHNTVHAPVFRERRWNQLFQIVLSPTYGHPVSMFVPGHNLSHHKHLQTSRDRMRTDKMRFRWNLLNQLLFNFYVGPQIFRDNAEYARVMRERHPKWYQQFLFELVGYGAFLVITLVLFLALGGLAEGGLRWLVFVVVPHQYAVWGISGINFVQHDGCDPEHPYNHSRNFTSKLVNWFTFNNGYHGIHHMHPGLHWSLAPEAHARELAPHIDRRLDEPSLFVFLFKQYIFPGKRLRFDGTPVVLGPELADETWIQGTTALRDEPVSVSSDELGAITS